MACSLSSYRVIVENRMAKKVKTYKDFGVILLFLHGVLL